MPIEIIDPRQHARHDKRRTELLLTRRLHSWLLRYPEPGNREKMHCHNADETFVCIEGECTMSFPDGGKAMLAIGMAALIPGGHFYEIENTGDGPLILMGTRSGARETTKRILYETREQHRASVLNPPTTTT